MVVLSLIDTTEEERVVFPGHTTNSAKLIFWIPAGRPVCDPAGSLTFRVGPWLLLCLSRWPLHPGERRSRMARNGDLRLADETQIGAVSGGPGGAQGRCAGARCPAHDHPVRSQPVPVRAELRRALVGHHTTDFRTRVPLSWCSSVHDEVDVVVFDRSYGVPIGPLSPAPEVSVRGGNSCR